MTQKAVQIALENEPEAPFTAAEQMDLLGLAPTPKSEQLPQTGEARRGRPKGALNKQTLEWAEFLDRQFRHPLVTLAAIQSSGIDELAARLGCTKLEALQEIRIAAAMLLPYRAKKMPIAVNVNGKILHLNILAGDEQLPAEDVLELMPEPAPQEEP